VRTLGLGAWLRLALLAGLLLGGLVIVRQTGIPDPDQVRSSLNGTGSTGLVAFIAAYVVCSLLVLPKGLLSIAAGVTWGLLPGVAVVMAGALLGATAAFWLGRWLGRDTVTRLAGQHLARLDGLVERHGVAAILVVRLIPVVPFTAVNYAAGLTAIRFTPYLLGTALGIVPGTVAYVALGAYGTDPRSWEFAAAVVAFLVLTIGGAFAVRRHRHQPVPEKLPSAPADSVT
jgi:uncharacterized membrane protein YdjX (TVP38/TMEM64 family)